MSSSAIGSLTSSYLQQLLANALKNSGVTANSAAGAGNVVSGSQSDSSQLSPFAQLVSTLQQLQESNPSEYQQVTQQIAANLQSAAQTDAAQGNTSGASQLNQLATDFTKASQSGQLPNLQDLGQAIEGHGGPHHHRAEESSDSGSESSGSASGASQTSNRSLLSLFQTSDSQSEQNTATNPASVILQTLANAGINLSNS